MDPVITSIQPFPLALSTVFSRNMIQDYMKIIVNFVWIPVH